MTSWITIIINALVVLLSAGGVSWIFTIREDRKNKKLDNDKKATELEDLKRDEAIKEWKDLAGEYKRSADTYREEIISKDDLLQQKDDVISDLRNKLDERNTECAIAELMRCTKISCPDRQPPLGTKEIHVEDTIAK